MVFHFVELLTYQAYTRAHFDRIPQLQGLPSEQREAMTSLREDSRGRWKHALLDACEADLKTVCPEADDRWSRRQCLAKNREKVSSACQDAMRDARRAHRGHHRDGAEGGP